MALSEQATLIAAYKLVVTSSTQAKGDMQVIHPQLIRLGQLDLITITNKTQVHSI